MAYKPQKYGIRPSPMFICDINRFYWGRGWSSIYLEKATAGSDARIHISTARQAPNHLSNMSTRALKGQTPTRTNDDSLVAKYDTHPPRTHKAPVRYIKKLFPHYHKLLQPDHQDTPEKGWKATRRGETYEHKSRTIRTDPRNTPVLDPPIASPKASFAPKFGSEEPLLNLNASSFESPLLSILRSHCQSQRIPHCIPDETFGTKNHSLQDYEYLPPGSCTNKWHLHIQVQKHKSFCTWARRFLHLTKAVFTPQAPKTSVFAPENRTNSTQEFEFCTSEFSYNSSDEK